MSSNDDLIKSNSLSHLIDSNTDKLSDPLKVSIGVNCDAHQFLKPKIIDIFSRYNNKKKLVLKEYKKPFTNKKLKLIFKHDIPIYSSNQINSKSFKIMKNKQKQFYKGNINWLINSLSYKRLDENINFKLDKDDNILPKILEANKNYGKEKKIFKKKFYTPRLIKSQSENEKDFRVTSGMLSIKKLNQNRENKFRINSFMINPVKNSSLIDEEEEYNNSLINLNKDFTSGKIINNKRKINNYFIKRYSNSAMINSLLQRNSWVNKSNYSLSKSNISDNLINVSINNTIDTQRKPSIIPNLKLSNNEDKSHLSKRYYNFLLNIKKNNNQIIDINRNIIVNCLISKIGKNLRRDKIIFDKNKKTIFELEKESSYRRVKKFENFINKLYRQKT